MFAKLYHNARDKAVGPELAAFLPVSTTPWYRKSELLYLNFCLVSLFLLSSSNGYDGSMMNGLQALPQWHKFMDNPEGAWLGFINAAQVLGGGFMLPPIAWMSNRYGRWVSKSCRIYCRQSHYWTGDLTLRRLRASFDD